MPRVLAAKMILLPTAMVKVFVENEYIGLARVLCDTGAQANLTRYNLVKNYAPNTTRAIGDIVGIDDSPIHIRKSIDISILPCYAKDNEKKICANVLVLPKRSKWCPTLPDKKLPCNLVPTLADPLFWNPNKIDLLFGIELWAEIIQNNLYKLGPALVSQQTSIGNVIYGRIDQKSHVEQIKNTTNSVYMINTVELDKIFNKFWEFEDISLCTEPNPEHTLIEKMFKATHARDENGRFIIEIPINPNITQLGSSCKAALRRCFMLEKKFQKEPEFKEKYIEFMREYESLGHMVEAIEQPADDEMVYYLPHHGVMTSNKFRTVFDGSCKTDLNLSLNQVQFVGPKLQRDLWEILVRCRRHKFAIITLQKCIDR